MLKVKDTQTGIIFTQEFPFETITRDWNCDGDVYSEYGAFFTSKIGREFIPKHYIGKGNYFEIVK